MQRYFISVFTLVLVVSCSIEPSQNPPSEDRNLKVIEVKESSISSTENLSKLIEIDSLLIFEFSDESIIGDISKLVISDERIYILDMYVSKKIFCFDRSGRFLKSYQSIGRGPKEYTEIVDFSVFNNQVYVLAVPHRLFILDKDLEFQKAIEVKWTEEMPFHNYAPPNISVIGQDTIIIASIDAPFKYSFYNLKTKRLISQKLPSLGASDKHSLPLLTKSSSGKIFISPDYSDTIYQVDGSELIAVYNVNYEIPMSNKEIADHLSHNPWNVSDIPRTKGMHLLRSFMDDNDILSFTFEFNNRRHFYFSNQKDSTTIIFPNNVTNDLWGAKFINRIIIHHGRSFVTFIEPCDLVEYNRGAHLTIPDDLNYDSNPVLVFYRPKF